MRRLAVLAAMAVALGAPAGLAAPVPQTTVNEIEGEVMCPICGTLLELAESPQAQRERAYVAKLVAAGKSRAEIKDALVAQYGASVLALPKATGFDLTAYLVPILALLAAIAGLAISVAHWRRAGGAPVADPPQGRAASGPADDDAARLETDISRYDL